MDYFPSVCYPVMDKIRRWASMLIRPFNILAEACTQVDPTQFGCGCGQHNWIALIMPIANKYRL